MFNVLCHESVTCTRCTAYCDFSLDHYLLLIIFLPPTLILQAVHDKEGALGGLLWWVLRWGWNVLRFGIGFLGLEAGAGGGGWCMAWSDHEQEVGVRVLLLVMWVTMQWGQVSART